MSRQCMVRGRRCADQERTKHVLLQDDLGHMTLRRWQRMLDRALAAGTSPETSVGPAARAMQLTSAKDRLGLATSVQRILAAAGQPPAVMLSPAAPARPPQIPINRVRISHSAVTLANLGLLPGRAQAGPGYRASRWSASCSLTAARCSTTRTAVMI